MNKVVEIKIAEDTFYEGGQFTSVDFMASAYGGGCPCTTAEEIARAIRHAKECISANGDRFIIKDLREKATLRAWWFK